MLNSTSFSLRPWEGKVELVRRVAAAVTLLFALLGAARAEDILPPSEAALTKVLQDLAGQTDAGLRQQVYIADRPQLAAAAGNDPALSAALVYLDTRLAGEAAAAWNLAGIESLGSGFSSPADLAQGSGRDFAEAAAALSLGMPIPDLQLYRLGEAWNGFLALGGTLKDLGPRQTKQVGTIIDKAGKVFKAGKGIDDYLNNNDADVSKDVEDVLGLVTPGMSLPLAGPASVAFSDLMGWDASMFDKTTQGIDLLNNAIETGHLDQAKLAQLTQQIKTLAHQGPWGSSTAKSFLSKWMSNFPKLNKLLGALWPFDTNLQCHLINCDCSNVEAGLLTKPYEEECKQSEERITKMCQETGMISGTCNPGGPAAFPF